MYAVLGKRGLVATIAVATLCLLAALPQAASASFPGRAGVIVFNLRTFDPESRRYTGGLHALRVPQSQPRQLTRNLLDLEPSFSPSGRQLVFRRSDSSRPGLHVLNLRSGRSSRVTKGGLDRSPAFGRRGMIAFTRATEGQKGRDLFVRTPDRRVRRLTSTPAAIEDEPVFTPDGELIVFVRTYWPTAQPLAAGPPSPRLYSIRPDGTGLRALGATNDGFHLDIAPNGRSLVFETDGLDTARRLGSAIWTKRLCGGGERRIKRNAASPVYSPAGNQLAYVNLDGIWLRRTDGLGDPRLIFPTVRPETGLPAPMVINLAWQPLPK
jgi:hypothetical protein